MAYGNRRRNFRRRFNRQIQMHKIICSDCGKEGEVPFKPREGTAVYCKDCFMKRKGIPLNEKKETTQIKEQTDKIEKDIENEDLDELEEDDEGLEEIEEESEEFE